MVGTRIDKWLWAARFFKTRELASKACEMSRITSNGQRAKPAREVRVGDMLQIRNEAAEWEIEVLALSQRRGSHRAGALPRDRSEHRAPPQGRRRASPARPSRKHPNRSAQQARSPPHPQLQWEALTSSCCVGVRRSALPADAPAVRPHAAGTFAICLANTR
jgi:ribosome-associated heat shock protein Hsp15